jgi:hypothetical protein
MSHTEKDRLAAAVEERWLEFQDGLSDKRKYPIRQFRAFWQAGVRYAEQVKQGVQQQPGGQAAIRSGAVVCGRGRKLGYQRRNTSSSSPSRTFVRVCNNRCAPRSVHPIC